MPTYGGGTYGGGTYGDLSGLAAATLAAQIISRSGIVPVFTAADPDGDRVLPSSRMFVFVRNASAATVTVTPSPTFVNVLGGASLPIPVSVPAGSERMVGPFPAEFYRNSEGLLDVAMSATEDVAMAVLEIP